MAEETHEDLIEKLELPPLVKQLILADDDLIQATTMLASYLTIQDYESARRQTHECVVKLATRKGCLVELLAATS